MSLFNELPKAGIECIYFLDYFSCCLDYSWMIKKNNRLVALHAVWSFIAHRARLFNCVIGLERIDCSSTINAVSRQTARYSWHEI